MRKAHFEKAQSKINRKLRVKNLCCNIFVVFLKCILEKGLGGFQHIPCLYCQGSILRGITYVQRTSTTELDQLYYIILHQPFYNLQMYEEYILTTIRFPLVYDNNLNYDFFVFHPPGKQDHLAANIHSQLSNLNRICTEEVDLLELKRTNDLPSWYPGVQIPYLVKVNVLCSTHIASIKLIYVNQSHNPDIFPPYV